MIDASHKISLRIAANREDLLIARMTLSGLGMLAGLEMDLIGDLRTVTNECCDCLMHRTALPISILMEGEVRQGRLYICFTAEGEDGPGDHELPDMDVVRGVLETLMPEVKLSADGRGVSGIECSMPV